MSVAIYAGSFDPVTFGHLSIIRRAARLFDHVRVLVAHNPDKTGLFSPAERVALLAAVTDGFPQVSVDVTDGYVVEYARQIGAQCLVRGIRGGDDAEAETHLAALNRTLAPELETLLLPAESGLVEVSSSTLKARARLGESLLGLCPEPVARQLRARFHTEMHI
jgi:pantetheine-phosphate adenylyltransferase